MVDPMVTDISPWCASDSQTYARLLRVEEGQLVQHHHGLLQSDRKPYFSEIPATGDLFLDPDIGIKTGGRNRTRNTCSRLNYLADGCYQRSIGRRLSALPDGHAP